MSFLCLYGKGTKISKYLIEHDKIYEAELTLGKRTDTGDREGNVIEEKRVKSRNMQEEKVRKTLQKFLGKQEQIPPMYSAIKVKGKKLYEYAREGKNVEVPKRQIEIYDIKLKEIEENSNKITFTVHTSKGTYIRTLCEDIAKALGEVRNNDGFKKNKSAVSLV